MSAAVVLPMVWAMQQRSHEHWGIHQRTAQAALAALEEPATALVPELAFYRKYTEGMLRRYVRLSMEAGRVPSLLGKEMFRGKVTSYRVHSFEDVVIFVYDVEKCLNRLDTRSQELIARIGLQEYTQAETAGLLGVSLRTIVRQYADALDKLTAIFLETKLLEPHANISCQVPKKGVLRERG
ncbi:MAG TPA: sigma factor-like helix-turn-helix DNA-binding protein [Acidobacteriaceae bacterium]